MSLDLVVETGLVRLYCGDATEYAFDDVDVVLTHLYAPLPMQLRDKPLILSGFADRKGEAEALAGRPLTEIARWHREANRQAVWVANLEARPIDLGFLAAEELEHGRGWWPLDLPVRLLMRYDVVRYDFDARESGGEKSPVVWDGFCGRGTTGMACRLLGLRFVGIDISPDRVALARKYLGV